MVTKILNFWLNLKATILIGHALYIVFFRTHAAYSKYLYKQFLKALMMSLVKRQKPLFTRKPLYVNLNSASLANKIFAMVGVARLGEKINIDIKFHFPDCEPFFENPTFISPKKEQPEGYEKLEKTKLWENYAMTHAPSEYGYKIISKLAIRQDLQKQADKWIDSNLQEDWIGVHYRGTDLKHQCIERLVNIEDYIDYLKEVLDSRCSIFACSDQMQFISQIKEAFPGQVSAREIIRSHDDKPLHRAAEYNNAQQRQDAFLDVLVLSRAKLIYTTGSFFADLTRFFNPSIKIISFELLRKRFKYHSNIHNFHKPQSSLLSKK